MKKTFLIYLMLLLAATCFAQKNPIRFLDIPIDGPTWKFDQKLRQKGFRYINESESYKGPFNGKHVDVYIHTNHKIVDRIVVFFPTTSKQELTAEYNHLLEQLNNNDKYVGFFNNEIPNNEDISYEIKTNNKRYDCSFYYYDTKRDPIAMSEALAEMIFKDSFDEDGLAYFKEITRKGIESLKSKPKDIFSPIYYVTSKLLLDGTLDDETAYSLYYSLEQAMRKMADGIVWFTIDEPNQRIVLYYDNVHNQAHGEDL